VSEFKLRKLEIAPVPSSANNKPEWATIEVGLDDISIAGSTEHTEHVRIAPAGFFAVSWCGNTVADFYERWLNEHPLKDEDESSN
jgi:hypothetical protein